MILISSCLVGHPVRYDGRDQLNSRLKQLVENGKAMPVCPELMGGLRVPREPAEIRGGDGEAVWQGHAVLLRAPVKTSLRSLRKGLCRRLLCAGNFR